MNRTVESARGANVPNGRAPAGGFLDALPSALFVAAHVAFLAVGLWLWWRAYDNSLPYSGALFLYAASQLGFFAYFARWFTMKMAVLAEQTLVFAMLLLIVLRAT